VAERALSMLLKASEQVRLLPVVMLAAGLLLAVKLGHLAPLVGQAFAEAPAKTEKTKNAKPAAVSPDEGASAKMPERTVPPSVQRPTAAQGAELSPGELEVLQSLAKRREQLEAAAAKRDKELALKANLLAATEAKVEERIAALKKMEAQVSVLLKKYDEQEEKRLKSLVKVYENMKPKDAARIFEEMDGTLLLDMIERMKEQKVSLILGLMEPAKAKKITQDLGQRRPLPSGG
jgi:flagellar motility protein MotE (MotC chaperone)